jgi:phage terminase large subunit-like protein
VNDRSVNAVAALAKELVEFRRGNKLSADYRDLYERGHVGGPYAWQEEFHTAGAENPQRCLLAGNRVGKTRTGGAECAIHATGRYPDWWRGRRFSKPTLGWACGIRNEDVREVTQKELLGNVESGGGRAVMDGSGWVPKECILNATFRTCGVSGVIDSVNIKHVSGGTSRIVFKSYQQRAIAFQGVAVDWCWMDEEPEDDKGEIFAEILARLVTTEGILIVTRTPLLGMTKLVDYFVEGGHGIYCQSASWDDCPHISEKVKREFAASFPEWQRETRMRGVPLMGTSAVYKVPQEQYRIDPIDIPDHWRRIAAIDFGVDHPAAVVWIAHDEDADVAYVYDCYKAADQAALYHAERIKRAGAWIPLAWPHDGVNRDKGNATQLIEQYIAHGVNALPRSARYDEETGGSQSRWRMTNEIIERMLTGRFKIFSTCTELLKELQRLHRNGIVIEATDDDLESAMRYAMMDLRHAIPRAEAAVGEQIHTTNRAIEYDPHAA